MARILITSGPTRQPLDPVRFLTNGSSGRMGAALAEAVLARGGTPVIVSGPVAIEYPAGSEVHRVVTTDEMRDVAVRLFTDRDCIGVLGAAAPCDFRPESVRAQKIKRATGAAGGGWTLTLVPTPDIVQSLGAIKRPDQWVVSFALETESGHANALAKLRDKRADFVVLNAPVAIDADESSAEVFDTAGRCLAKPSGPKRTVAASILSVVWKDC